MGTVPGVGGRTVATCALVLICASSALRSDIPAAQRIVAGDMAFRMFGFCADGHIAATDGKSVWQIDWPSGAARSPASALTTDRPPCTLRALGSSADGRWWAAPASGGSVVVRDGSGATTQTLSADTAETNGVVFSPDGQWLASGGLDNDIHVWDARSWRPVATITTLSHAAFALAWSPDSKELFVAGASRTVVAVTAGVWKVGRSSAPAQTVLTRIAVSPDGRTVVAAGFDPRSSKLPAAIRFLDASTLKDRRNLPTATEVFGLAFSPDGQSLLALVGDQKGILVWPVE